ncbi:MAG TPA: hemerythrin domain-containing protein [Holophaga sp.]|mgnify:CR=1 FL=1|nr:hemerythrin domain-containing protein [Holophaga sp.]HPS67327.1 hemerythrin domain-containing protein [Holophaga sp.]
MIHDPDEWNRQRVELDAWKTATVTDLVVHIMERYHRETRMGMAELESFAEEAALMEGHKVPLFIQIRDEVDLFCTEMRAHLRMEEVTLFPAILAKEEGREVSVQQELMDPVELFEDEHESAAGLLKRIWNLTQGYTAPDGAPQVQRDLYRACKTLAESLVRHIYLENEILFKEIQLKG